MTADPGRAPRFHWRLDDERTTVDIQLVPSATGTDRTLTQEPLPMLDELMAPRAGLLELKRMHELGDAWATLVRELPE